MTWDPNSSAGCFCFFLPLVPGLAIFFSVNQKKYIYWIRSGEIELGWKKFGLKIFL